MDYKTATVVTEENLDLGLAGTTFDFIGASRIIVAVVVVTGVLACIVTTAATAVEQPCWVILVHMVNLGKQLEPCLHSQHRRMAHNLAFVD